MKPEGPQAVKRVVIKPRVQIAVLVAVFGGFGLIGLTAFTEGDVVAERDWFGIVMGTGSVLMGVVGIWRSLRLGVVIDASGIRVRAITSRDQVTPWASVESVGCVEVERRGLPIYAPVVYLADGGLPVMELGSYVRSDVEARVDEIRRLMGQV